MTPAAALELRDIHVPPPPGWWPPAPGWWVLALLLLVALVYLGCALARQQRLRRQRRTRASALATLRMQHARGDSGARLAALSELLRRACKRHAPEALLLQGEAWLQFLDRGMDTAPFSTGPGRLLLDGPYRRTVDPAAVDELLLLVERRLQTLPGASP
jgi:hypothetical protein